MDESEGKDRSCGHGDQGEAVSTLLSSSLASAAVKVVPVPEVPVTSSTLATTTAPKRAKHSTSNPFEEMFYHDLVTHFRDPKELANRPKRQQKVPCILYSLR